MLIDAPLGTALERRRAMNTTENWHPAANNYPLLEGEEYEAFKKDIEIRGVLEPVKYREVGRKGPREKQFLDGRNRMRACKELGIRCPTKLVHVGDDNVEEYIDSLNLHRRHLSQEQRQARVEILRAKGQSTWQIAQALGVDQKTVRNDIADIRDRTPSSGEEFSSPETVVGRDGKTYSASQPKQKSWEHPSAGPLYDPKAGAARQPEPLLCSRCARFVAEGGQSVRDCQQCAELRDAKKRPKPPPDAGDAWEGYDSPKAEQAEKDAAKAAKAIRDHLGNEVPKHLRDLFANPFVADAIRQVKQIHKVIRGDQRAYPYLHGKPFFDACDALVGLLEHGQLWVVCPECHGDGCKHCRASGYLGRGAFEEKEYRKCS
jgi:ParB-like chromosome segregation protein Spo0J